MRGQLPAGIGAVVFKLLLLGYPYGVRSERQLMQEVVVNVAYRWLLVLKLRDRIPNSSTLSQNWRRSFAESTIYQEISIVELAMSNGQARIVLYSDSTHLKASANKMRFELAEVAVKPAEYLQALEAATKQDHAAQGKKPLKDKPAATPETRQIKVSRTDPDAGYMCERQAEEVPFAWTTAP